MSKQNELAQLADVVTVDGSNVGIGTSSPTAYTGYSTVGLNGTNGGVLEFKKGDTQMSRISNAGDLAIQFATNNAERLRIDSDGLKFHGDTAAANALNDYETGTWSAGAWSSQANKYVKIGNLVMLTLDVLGPLSGTISQFTLPFTCTGTSGTAIYSSNVNFNNGYTAASLVVAGTQGYIRQCGDNVAFAALGIGQNGILHANITYNTTQ